jgi:hypothetical protein
MVGAGMKKSTCTGKGKSAQAPAVVSTRYRAAHAPGRLRYGPEQHQVVLPTSSGNLVRYPFFLEKVWKPLLSRAKLP